jgi:hypothetical protein
MRRRVPSRVTCNRLADIAGLVVGDPEKGREYAEKRPANRRVAEPVS